MTLVSQKIPLWTPLTLLTSKSSIPPIQASDCQVDLNRIPLFLEEKTGAEKALKCSQPLTDLEASKILTDLTLEEMETKLAELRIQAFANLDWVEDMKNTTSRMAEEAMVMKEQMESMMASMPSQAMLASLPPQELLATFVSSPQLSKIISSLNVILEEMEVMMKDTGMEVEFQQLKVMMENIGSLPSFTVNQTSVASIFKDWNFVATRLVEILNLTPATISSLAMQAISPAPLVLLSLRSSSLVSSLCRQENPPLIHNPLIETHPQWGNAFALRHLLHLGAPQPHRQPLLLPQQLLCSPAHCLP